MNQQTDKPDYSKPPPVIKYADGAIGYRAWMEVPVGTEPQAIVTCIRGRKDPNKPWWQQF
jgi:hypothetical protein